MSGVSVWSPPRGNLILAPDDVHVWRVPLDAPASEVRALCKIVSLEERAMAERFRFERVRTGYLVAHAALRAILARYIGLNPQELLFQHNPYGKPALHKECGGEELRFNLSHSQELALCAVTRDRDVGVDIERVREDVAIDHVAAHFFAAVEIAALRSLSANLRREAFYACWTRKEAYLKARGQGLSLAPGSFAVELLPGRSPAILHVEEDAQEAWRWSVVDLMPAPGFAAALVVEGQNWRLKCWQWAWDETRGAIESCP